MANLIIRDSGSTGPSRGREFGAGLLAGGLNRRILGNRFRANLPDSTPMMFWQLRFGATLDALAKDVSTPTSLFLRRDATIDFTISYGLPGRAGYTYTRPLDYFDFQGSFLPSTFSNFVENIMVRGLLVGGKTKDTENQRGIWGLYGSYDYISPYLFRVSSTAALARHHASVPAFAERRPSGFTARWRRLRRGGHDHRAPDHAGECGDPGLPLRPDAPGSPRAPPAPGRQGDDRHDGSRVLRDRRGIG